MKILIADDHEDAAAALAELLRLSLPCDVVVTGDGDAAWHATLHLRPDAVLLDLFMPDLGGLEVADRVRRHYGDRRPMLVALTGRRDAARHLPDIDRLFDRVFVKPVDVGQLVAALAERSTGDTRRGGPFDLAELFTRLARQALPVALARGLAFSFDYIGATVSVDGHLVATERALHRLMLAAVDMLSSGFVMFSATAALEDAGGCTVLVEAAGTGTPRSAAEVGP